MLPEQNEAGQMISHNRVAGSVVTGNEDGAKHCIAETAMIEVRLEQSLLLLGGCTCVADGEICRPVKSHEGSRHAHYLADAARCDEGATDRGVVDEDGGERNKESTVRLTGRLHRIS